MQVSSALALLLLNLMSLLKDFIFSVSNHDIIERGNVAVETIAATASTNNTTDSDGKVTLLQLMMKITMTTNC